MGGNGNGLVDMPNEAILVGEQVESVELVEWYREVRMSMSSAEARERFVAALLAQESADAQLRLLPNARIDDVGDRSTEMEAAVGALTLERVSDVTDQLLEKNVDRSRLRRLS